MRVPVRALCLFLALCAAAVAWLALSKRQGAQPSSVAAASDAGKPLSDPRDAVPESALLVATIDVRALRRTTLGERLFGGGRRLPGLGLLTELCPVDPMAGVERLAIAVPAREGDADFGVVATGTLDADALLECAATVVRKRGGQPIVSPAGRFQVLRDSAANEPGAELAAAPGGPVLLGQGAYLRSSIDAAEGRLPSVRQSEAHARLSHLVGTGVIVATVVLTPALRRTLVEELSAQGTPDSPLAAVSAAAASVALEPKLDVAIVLECDRPSACADAGSLLESSAREHAAALAPRAPEAAAILAEAHFRPEERVLHITLSVGPERALRAADELLGTSPR